MRMCLHYKYEISNVLWCSRYQQDTVYREFGRWAHHQRSEKTSVRPEWPNWWEVSNQVGTGPHPVEMDAVSKKDEPMKHQRNQEKKPHFDETEEDVGVESAFMRLVDHHDGVGGEIGLAKELAQQHTVGHVLHYRPLWGAVLKANSVAHLETQLHRHLLCHSRCHRHCCDSSRLCATDSLTGLAVAL